MPQTHGPGRRARPRYYLTLARGERIRCVSIRPLALYAAVIAGGAIVAAGVLGAASVFNGTPSTVQEFEARQAETRAAYEDRLAALREQMDIAAQSSVRERDSLEAQMRQLQQRQAVLDSRAEVIGRLAQSTGLTVQTPPNSQPLSSADAQRAVSTPRAISDDPTGAYAKPRPEGLELGGGDHTSALDPRDLGGSLQLRLATLAADANRVQAKQANAVGALSLATERSANVVKAALAKTGLSIDRLRDHASRSAPPAEGGPYIPVRLDTDGSALETAFEKLQDRIDENQRIGAALPYLPLRHPLAGRLEMTSPFGIRPDPFLGRLAEHPGEDFRAAIGESVLATGAGKVTGASYDGGYGNMVEINHGDGLSTRYGHLSAILVRVGQTVSAGQVIGRTGSTGRSTGPHLHYEVRVDGQPIDPTRFLRAGDSIADAR